MRPLPKPLTVAEIAKLVGGEVVGDASVRIEAIAEISSAGPKDVASFHNMKYAPVAARSEAGCLLIPPPAKDAPARACARIVAADPQAAFGRLIALIDEAQRPRRAPGVSAKASVHPSAKLGADVHVGDFAVVAAGAAVGDRSVLLPHSFIGEKARIGKECLIYPQAVVREDCVLGDRVILQPGAVIGSDGFGYTTDRRTGRHAKLPQLGNVVLEDDVEIGANTTIDRAAIDSTVIGAGTKIDNLVQIGHNARVGRDCFLVAQSGVAGTTKLGNGVILGGQVGVAGHLTVCDRAQVGAQSGVMSDVEPEAPGKPPVLFGSPARSHRDAFKIQALLGRLSEMFDRIKEIEKKLSL